MTGKAKTKLDGEPGEAAPVPVAQAFLAAEEFPAAPADERVLDVIGKARQQRVDVEVTLAHHWPDPLTGENHLPESTVIVDADTAAGLAGGGGLLRGAKARLVYPAAGDAGGQ